MIVGSGLCTAVPSTSASVSIGTMDGEDWLIRFPLPGKSMFLDEKVRREALLMKFIKENTDIPVPRVIAYGTADENPTGLGPFIIMTWIEGKEMSDILQRDDTSGKERGCSEPGSRPADLRDSVWADGGDSARTLETRS